MKILIIAGNARSLVANRGDLVRELQLSGHCVVALVPEYDTSDDLNELGIECRFTRLQRFGMNPLNDVIACLEMSLQIRQMRPDMVFSYTIKPVIFGSLAAWIVGVRWISCMITGLGYLFTGTSWRQRIGQWVARCLYGLALPRNQVVFFQNPDDMVLFQRLGLLKRVSKIVQISGSGVNLERYSVSPLPRGYIRFLLIARLVDDKGIYEFVGAAESIKQQFVATEFMVLGPYDRNLPRAIQSNILDSWKAKEIISFNDAVKDVRPMIADCSVLVLPSYREGTPRSVLEAMAMGRPVITTDTPGCRETIRLKDAVFEQEHNGCRTVPEYRHFQKEGTKYSRLKFGANGILVPPRDANSLELAMRFFLEHPEQIADMGRESRRYAEERYDVHIVNATIIKHLGL